MDSVLLEELNQKFKRLKFKELLIRDINSEDLQIIHNLYVKNIKVSGENFSGIVCFYYAGYYEYVEKNPELMKQYFLAAIDQGNSNAMNILGLYYKSEKNYELMKEYYEMAVEQGNSSAMNNLAYYYQNVEKNIELMKRYYEMAIEKRKF